MKYRQARATPMHICTRMRREDILEFKKICDANILNTTVKSTLYFCRLTGPWPAFQ
jgi:hypothetical protein